MGKASSGFDQGLIRPLGHARHVFIAVFCLSLASQSFASTHHKVHHHHKGHHRHRGHHHHGKHRDKVSRKDAPSPLNTTTSHSGKSSPAVAKLTHPAGNVAPTAKSSPAVAKLTHPAVHVAAAAAAQASTSHTSVTDGKLLAKMKEIEKQLARKKQALVDGQILVNGPLPSDFNKLFVQAVVQATGVDASKVSVLKSAPVAAQPGIFTINFKAPSNIVAAVDQQSADADSKLTAGQLHSFLVAKGDDENDSESLQSTSEAVPIQEKSLDIDTEMPYGDLEPFGREDTAQELTEDSITESNDMVDQLERAEVAEEKRAVFRALTRLRGAAITSFDGIARSQTGNIDEYNKIHQWRNTHPLHHLADEESDVSKWAFPDNADF
jgi:hypothetical protein